jgi:Fe-S cluster assembly protein SufD
MTQLTETRDCFLKNFAAVRHGENAGPEWLCSLRDAAMARFEELGVPTIQEEEWRFTNLAPMAKIGFSGPEPGVNLTKSALKRAGIRDFGARRLTFVNGRFAPKLSSVGRLAKGVVLGSLADALKTHGDLIRSRLGSAAPFDKAAFAALNTALFEDGAFIFIPKGKVIEKPVQLLFISGSQGKETSNHPRNLVILEEGAQATLIETYYGIGDVVYLCNPVTEVLLGAGAVADHYRVQWESRNAYHLSTVQAHLGRLSNHSLHSVAFGAALSRNDIGAVLGGEGAEATANGLYMVSGQQLADSHTVIDHAVPHCESHELFKGILSEKARGVFNGRIIVRKDAQKTNAKQTNKNLLLSEHALVNTNPQLEIFADDVKCTHGATVGQLDEQSVFYLRSRGIDGDAARGLLTYAFANDILRRIKVEPLKENLEEEVLVVQHIRADHELLEAV